MSTVQKISFKSSTNLLSTFSKVNQQVVAPPPPSTTLRSNTAPVEAEQQVVKQPVLQPAPQVASKAVPKSIDKYIAPAALALSVLTVPTTYLLTRRSNTKAIGKLQNTINELTEKLGKLNIEKLNDTLNNSPQKLVSGKTSLVSVLLGIGTGVGIGEFINHNRDELKKMGYTDDDINEARNVSTNIVDNPQKALDLSKGLDSKVSQAVSDASNAKATAESMDARVNDARNRADEAMSVSVSGIKPEESKFFKKYYDLNIMQYHDWEKKINNQRTDAAMKAINNAAIIRLSRSADDTLKSIKAYKEKYKDKLTSTWALTAEFKPIKTGGLGDVPVDLQDNFTKLGIDNPVFIPMYETNGVSNFVKSDDGVTAQYKYDKKVYNLTKLAETDVDVCKGGKLTPQKVEFYLHKDGNKQLIFVRNKSFKGAIYENTSHADEPEKFALFSKAVYTLLKVKVSDALNDNNGNKPDPITLIKYPAYYELKAPNSLILNDWHSAPVAGLLRYKAAMEYNYNEIGDEMFDALTNMPILMIGHNLGLQGRSNDSNGTIIANNNVTQNIINTLYDKFAMGIVENAHSGIKNEDLCNTVLLKRTTADKHFNPLYHGIALSDWFVPVSKNYANEIVNDATKSHICMPLLQVKKSTGTIEGIINGTDLVKHNMAAVSKNNYVQDLVLETYDKNTDINKIMELRGKNKAKFYDMFVKPILDGTLDKPSLINNQKLNIEKEDFVKTPLLAFAHRLTGQKGVEILNGAIVKLFDNWENDFGDKPKPYFIIGGPPEEKDPLENLNAFVNPFPSNKENKPEPTEQEKRTKPEVLNRVIGLKGNMPNPALMSSCTYFVAPSTFEPCGLTQGECFAKGTPIIATNTGGYPDTIEDGKTGFLAPEINAQSLYETIVRALKMYYNEPEKYQQMIMNDLNVDFSWARPDKQGPIYEYTDKLGFDRDKLKDIATAA